MTDSPSEQDPTTGIDDDQLPEDLRPSEDNPLAEPLGDGEGVKSLEELDMEGGKAPEESEHGESDPEDSDPDEQPDAGGGDGAGGGPS